MTSTSFTPMSVAAYDMVSGAGAWTKEVVSLAGKVFIRATTRPLLDPDYITRLGYRWDPQIIHSLTFTLVFYPIGQFVIRASVTALSRPVVATGLTLLALLSLLPVLFSKGLRMYPFPAFSLLSLLAAFWSLLAFVLMIVLWAIAKNRFHDDGIKTSWGPLVRPSSSLMRGYAYINCIIAMDVFGRNNRLNRCLNHFWMRHDVRSSCAIRYIPVKGWILLDDALHGRQAV
jgi:hypothetical protein